jgi:hypothetical protein
VYGAVVCSYDAVSLFYLELYVKLSIYLSIYLSICQLPLHETTQKGPLFTYKARARQ